VWEPLKAYYTPNHAEAWKAAFLARRRMKMDVVKKTYFESAAWTTLETQVKTLAKSQDDGTYKYLEISLPHLDLEKLDDEIFCRILTRAAQPMISALNVGHELLTWRLQLDFNDAANEQRSFLTKCVLFYQRLGAPEGQANAEWLQNKLDEKNVREGENDLRAFLHAENWIKDKINENKVFYEFIKKQRPSTWLQFFKMVNDFYDFVRQKRENNIKYGVVTAICQQLPRLPENEAYKKTNQRTCICYN
jgi:hypothetical protein